jgi:hypothetical protein
VLVGGSVEGPPLASPPLSPAIGAAYIVASGATGDWAGKSQCVAAWTSGGWRFIAPAEGMSLYERSSGTWAVYRSGDWELGNLRGAAVLIEGMQVVGARAAAIGSPTGGSMVDSEARATLDAILGVLRGHGLIAT